MGERAATPPPQERGSILSFDRGVPPLSLRERRKGVGNGGREGGREAGREWKGGREGGRVGGREG